MKNTPKLKSGYRCPFCQKLGFIENDLPMSKTSVILSCGHIVKRNELVLEKEEPKKRS